MSTPEERKKLIEDARRRVEEKKALLEQRKRKKPSPLIKSKPVTENETQESSVQTDQETQDKIVYSKDIQTEEWGVDEDFTEDESEESSSMESIEDVNQVKEEIVPNTLSAEDIEKLQMTPKYLDFITHSTKIIQRVLQQDYDPLIEYSSVWNAQKDDEELLALEQVFECKFTHGRTVTSLSFNSKYPELFLGSYSGKLSDNGSDSHGGGVVIWSQMLPQRPEYVLHANSSVTKALFYKYNPQLVIGGTSSGHVVMWDIRERSRDPVKSTPLNADSHVHPIFGLEIVGTKNSHNIMSMSTDGRLCVWPPTNLSKSTQVLDLILMEQKQNICGYSMAFSKGDSDKFFIGSETGVLYSTYRYGQNSGQFQKYQAHFGPITSMSLHPSQQHFSDLILTSSVDWSVNLWSTKHHQPLFTFREFHDYVYDVQWSPVSPGLFATCDGEGNLSLWNLAFSSDSPLYATMVDQDRKHHALNCLKFSSNGQQIAVGSISGNISLFRIQKSSLYSENQEDQQIDKVRNLVQMWKSSLDMNSCAM